MNIPVTLAAINACKVDYIDASFSLYLFYSLGSTGFLRNLMEATGGPFFQITLEPWLREISSLLNEL